MSSALPSSFSYPTGLGAPRVLFSPLSREIKAGTSFTPKSRDEAPVPRPPRRTAAMPKPSRSKTLDGRHKHRRWAVLTMCDMFVLPRPRITPHVITPPESPVDNGDDNAQVVEEGRARQRERDDWAEREEHELWW